MSIKLKTPAEIATLREGGKRHAAILKALGEMVKPGISTLDLENEARKLIAEGGDEPAHLGYTPYGAPRPFPAALCVSVNEEIVHGIPNERPKTLKEGDIVTIDLSLIHKGLFTDSAITVPVGKIDEESKKLLKVTRDALMAGIAAIEPGGHVGDIGATIAAAVAPSGFTLAKDLVGHGVGYAIHEEPYVPNTGKPGAGEQLVPGMVFAVEPMVCAGKGAWKTLKDGYTIVTKDGSRSAHFEHTVAITEKGPIILTSHE